MKAVTCCLIAFLICNAECGRKVVQPLDRRANDDFIKMEGGGGVRPVSPAAAPAIKPGGAGGAQPPQVTPPKPQPAAVTPPKVQSAAVTPPKAQPAAVTPPKVQSAAVTPPKPQPQAAVTPARPAVYVPAKPAAPPAVSTPGYGSVQQLINYYDSQGRASPVRPYSYSQAVKQGKS